MPTASPTRLLPRPQTFAICPAENEARGTAAPCSKTLIAVTFSSGPRPTATSSRVPQRPGEEPHVGDLVPGRPALDLEDRARDRALGIAVRCRQELGDAGGQDIEPAPVIADPKNTGCTRDVAVSAASASRSRA